MVVSPSSCSDVWASELTLVDLLLDQKGDLIEEVRGAVDAHATAQVDQQ